MINDYKTFTPTVNCTRGFCLDILLVFKLLKKLSCAGFKKIVSVFNSRNLKTL